MDVNFAIRGFTKIIPIQFEDELKNLQIKIYDLKNLLKIMTKIWIYKIN